MTTNQILIGVGLILALAAGSQVLAKCLRIPAIIVLLPAGFVAGALTSDVNPQDLLGPAFEPLVSLSVAVILYDAGLSLDLRKLKGHTRKVVIRLIVLGVLITCGTTAQLAAVIAVAAACNVVRDDAGLIAAIFMGLALANRRGFDIPERRPFFETLVQLIIGVLFISISATVTPQSLRHLLLPTLAIVAVRWSGHTPKLYSLGVRPVSSLIDSPNLFSIVVAVLAGIVGVVSLTEARASALIGVFISVTTIPAAADAGLSIGYASWSEARGSTFQLLLNVVVLIAVGALVLRVQRIIWGGRERAEPPRNAPGAGPAAVTLPG